MWFEDYEMKRLHMEDRDFAQQIRQVLPLCHELLGEGLYSEERIRTICQSENHYFYIIQKEERLVGIFYCYADCLEAIPFAKDIRVSLPEHARVGVGQSIALKKEARHTGLSQCMLHYGTQLLFEREQAQAILVPAWMKGDKIPAKPHLEQCGYELLQIVEKPWASCKTLRCPFCKTVPCICDGAIYIKMREKQA